MQSLIAEEAKFSLCFPLRLCEARMNPDTESMHTAALDQVGKIHAEVTNTNSCFIVPFTTRFTKDDHNQHT